MHAVVFEVAMKPGIDPTVANAELDKMIGQVKTLPGFVRGIWTTDGTTGLSFQLYADENVARQLVDNATVPPGSTVEFRSARMFAVVRDTRRARLISPGREPARIGETEAAGEDDHASAPDPAVGGQERLGSRAHLCDEPAHRAPNWKFCKFKRDEPSATFGAPESAFRIRLGGPSPASCITLREPEAVL